MRFESASMAVITARPRPTANDELDDDVSKYESLFELGGLTESQRRAFLLAIRLIVIAFTDIGYGAVPRSRPVEPAGIRREIADLADRHFQLLA